MIILIYLKLLIKNFYFQKMYSCATFKPRPKFHNQMAVNYQSNINNDINRKIPISTNYPIKDKVYRKVITEANQNEVNDMDGKKVNKQFKFPIKGGSPGLKKNIVIESNSSTNKLCFSNNIGKIKRVKKTNPNQKAITQTGPIIQRTFNVQSQKNYQHEKRHFYQKEETADIYQNSKKQNIPAKKLIENKSGGNLYLKGRLNTEGTVDSTPSLQYGSMDLEIIEIVGQGTFGKVFKSKIKKTGQIVAIKKVFQDPKYKNRQIEIVNMLKGDFLMKVLGSFTTFQQNGQFLNIIMSFYQGDLYNHIRQNKRTLTTFDIKLISYQIFRGLLFIHQLKIAHRDIKPHNILYKGKKIALCDFGSAKILTNEPNLPYICSRCYRAPQLIFGATHYTTMIDIWSVGCVILQMINGSPLFMGQSSVDHLIQIIKILGTPTKTQVIDMNPNYDLNDYKFPKIKKRQWNKIFTKSDPLLLSFISEIMIYSPKQRLNAAEALAHQFFDELREEQVHKNIQKQYGINLLSFEQEQIIGHEHLLPKLIPQWFKQPKRNCFF